MNLISTHSPPSTFLLPDTPSHAHARIEMMTLTLTKSTTLRGWPIPSVSCLSALLMIVLLCLSTVSSHDESDRLYCVQCDHLDPACRYGHLEAFSCPANATHCFELRLFIGRGYGTFRGCIRKTDENNDECRRLWVTGYDAIGCMRACDWDGCNSGLSNPRPWQIQRN